MDELYAIEQEDDDAIDWIFGRVLDLMERGDFKGCDQLLQEVDLDRLSPTLMVAFLSITLWASLDYRPTFYNEVEARLRRIEPEDRVKGLLRGLH